MTTAKKVKLSRLFLHDDNPRFEGKLDEPAAIDELCKTEQILELARDIAENGLSPLERFMVFREDAEDELDVANFIVAEGNRRLCALKLLKDPRRAPRDLREQFKKMKSRSLRLPSTVEVAIIEDEDEREKWIKRAHNGTFGGKGRKAWDATQKTRHFKNSRNMRGQTLLDYAIDRGFLTSDDASGRLSHIVRLVSNPVMRNMIGLTSESEPQSLSRTRPLSDFDKMLTWLLDEAKDKNLGSQADAGKINNKAAELEIELGCNLPRLSQPVLLSDDCGTGANSSASVNHSASDPKAAGSSKGFEEEETIGPDRETDTSASLASDSKRQRSSAPKPPKKLEESNEIYQLLVELNNYKLHSLFYSITNIELTKNVPALTVVAWSFLDSLSVALGRPESGNISTHWSRGNLSRRNGVASRDAAKSIEDAFDRIARSGNSTKHHVSSAGFDAAQLASDWEIILPVLEHDLREKLKQ